MGGFNQKQRSDEKGNRKFAKTFLMVSIICRMMKEKKTIPEIARVLKKEEKEIEEYYMVIEKHSPDYHVRTICNEILRKNEKV